MTRIVDTTPEFEAFAQAAALESPYRRDEMWRELYEGAHRVLFDAFYALPGMSRRPGRMTKELPAVRRAVGAASPALREIIGEVSPAVQEILGLPAEPAPVHILLVGSAATNAVVGRVGDDVAVFHCMEWYRSPEGARVLTAHEAAHAWHRLTMAASPPDDDVAWTAFTEGFAIQVSRQVVPGRPEHDYFWYDIPGFTGWVEWCREHRQELTVTLRAALDDRAAAEALFDGEPKDGPPRVGYFVADALVASLQRPLTALVRTGVDDAVGLVRSALRSA